MPITTILGGLPTFTTTTTCQSLISFRLKSLQNTLSTCVLLLLLVNVFLFSGKMSSPLPFPFFLQSLSKLLHHFFSHLCLFKCSSITTVSPLEISQISSSIRLHNFSFSFTFFFWVQGMKQQVFPFQLQAYHNIWHSFHLQNIHNFSFRISVLLSIHIMTKHLEPWTHIRSTFPIYIISTNF